MEKISPTRMNLLSRKSQLSLAREGVSLLKHKREVLMAHFIELVKPLMEKRGQLHKDMVQAFQCMNTARAVDGLGDMESASFLREHSVGIEIRKESYWGVEIPKIDEVFGLGERFREPNAQGVSLRIFETRDRFEQLIDRILDLAPLEASLKRLGREIQKTTRRINALEEMLIPRIRNEISFIQRTLVEREREDNYRLKRIKNKRESLRG